MIPQNHVSLTGKLVEKKARRVTPAGIPVVECTLHHASSQIEVGAARQVECEIKAVALGESAVWLDAAAVGTSLCVTGFLAAAMTGGGRLKLHLTQIELIEGN